MSEFDKTKKAIGIGGMDDKSRKAMFEKFQAAGGKVVSEKEKQENQSRGGRPGPNVRQGARSTAGGRSASSVSQDKSKGGPKVTAEEMHRRQEAELGSFINRFAIKLKCWMGRVTPFGAPELLPGFMSDLNLKAKKALLELHLVGNDLFANPAYGPAIAKALDSVNPLFTELIGRVHKMYDSLELGELTDPHASAPDMPIPIHRVRQPLYSLFKKMYYVYPYQSSYRKALEIGYNALQKEEKKNAMIYIQKKKKALAEFDRLFGDIFDKMYLAILRSENKNIPLSSPIMERILGIVQEEKPGQRKAGEQLSEMAGGDSQPLEEETEEEKEEDKGTEGEDEANLSKEMRYGLRLMEMYTLDKLRGKHDPKKEFESIPSADKAFLSYLFFKEFDSEYSFVMTTKKIDLKPTIVHGSKVDFRQKLLDLYETTRGPIDQFKIYVDVLKELEEHKKNPGANYIEASKKMTALETKRGQQSRNVRVTVKEFMEKTRDILSQLIRDMKGKKEVVGNMDDIITFDLMESKRRLNKKPIKQCIMEAYCFSLALAERLDNGDLFGGLPEITPEDMEKIFGVKTQKSDDDSGVDDSFGTEPEKEAEPVNKTEAKDDLDIDSSMIE